MEVQAAVQRPSLAGLRAMRRYGGSFANAIAAAFETADHDNTKRLAQAFPELIAKYEEMAGGAQ